MKRAAGLARGRSAKLALLGLVVARVTLAVRALLERDQAAAPAHSGETVEPREPAVLTRLEPAAEPSEANARLPARIELGAIPEHAAVARLHGRVLDTRGSPIARADVYVAGYMDSVGNLQTLNPEPRKRYKAVEYRTSTGENGEYSLDVPLDELFEGRVGFRARYFIGHVVKFGFDERGEQLPLSAGDTEWPDVALVDAGDLSGSLVDQSGQPVADANVNAFGRAAHTAIDGTFVMENVSCGLASLSTFKLGYEPTRLDGIDIRPRARTEVGDVVVRAKRGIHALVVTESGEAPGTTIGFMAHPRDLGPVIEANANYKGQLFLGLVDGREYVLSPREPWQIPPEHGPVVVNSQARDLRITVGMKRYEGVLERLEFHVRETATGRPVTRFRIALADEPLFWNTFRPETFWDPRHLHAEDGKHLVTRAKRHGWVYCESPDHAPLETKLVEFTGETSTQVLRLDPGARIRGQLVGGAHAALRLVRQSIGAQGQALDKIDDHSLGAVDSYGGLTPYTGRRRYLRCDAEGHFAFEGLSGGTYQLLLHHPTRGALQRTLLTVATGATLDLGRIE